MSNSGYYAAAASAAGSFLGAGPSYGFNAMGASLAFDRQKKLIIRGPGYAVQGLKRAGLNPILAASGGLRIGGAGSAQQAHAAQNSNAGLAAQQAMALSSQASAADAARDKSLADAAIVRSGQPRADFEAAFYSTQEGRDLALLSLQNEAIPNTAAGLAGKAAYSATRGRSPEFDAVMGAISNAPGALYRRYQKRQIKNKQKSWQFNQPNKAR